MFTTCDVAHTFPISGRGWCSVMRTGILVLASLDETEKLFIG